VGDIDDMTKLIARVGLHYPKDAAAAAEIAAVGGISELPDGWDRLLKHVEPGEDCTDLPAGSMRDWLLAEGHVEAITVESPKGGGKKG
jgi:hypothetical protein